ncbi:MAG TPA: Rieske 2Fe-2S domain-containing protein [Chloroflexota bacterium]|jgi:nitrite reductase (NADH) small subunit
MMDDERWVEVARAEDVPPGTVRACWVGAHEVALVNRGGELCAIAGGCPHRGGPLGEGRLVGAELACPWHAFRFDPRTGQATMPAAFPALPVYQVRVVDGAVQVARPEGGEDAVAG